MRRLAVALAILAGCTSEPRATPAAPPTDGRTTASIPASPSPSPSAGSRYLVAAGDIACAPGEAVTRTTCHQRRTAELLEHGGPLSDPLAVLLLGDVQYESGTTSEFRSFDATWGRALERSGAIVLPVTGNHEYAATGPAPPGCRLTWAGHHACGFAEYFAGRTNLLEDGDVQYAVTFDAAQPHPLHVIVLDVGACDWDTSRCGGDGPVVRFLRRALADRRANPPAACTIVAWHQARWSDLGHGDLAWVDPVWRALFSVPPARRPDLVLNGHDHVYERFHPLGVDGSPRSDGIPEIVAGPGGRDIAGVPSWFLSGSDRLAEIEPMSFGVVEVAWNPSTPELTTRFVGEDGAGRDRSVHPCHV